MTHQQLATWDLKRPQLGYVKLVIGLECFQTLINTVENVLFAKALNHPLPIGKAWEMVAVDILVSNQ